jgi:NADPH:quinone reductase-like Zn-dependent oxidoreductase
VFCAIGAQRPGTHAQYVLVSESSAAKKPQKLSHVEAAALPYVSTTVWSALVTVAHLKPSDCSQMRVLIHGGAGGTGSLAIQLLRAWGATVVATCSADSFEMVKLLGAIPIDYRSDTAFADLVELSPFDVVLDTVDSPLARQSDDLMGIWRNCVHVSIVSPLLRDSDQLGFPLGLFRTAATYFSRSLEVRPLQCIDRIPMRGCLARVKRSLVLLCLLFAQ